MTAAGLEPVFEFKLRDRKQRGCLGFSARYVSPLGNSMFLGLAGGTASPPLVVCDTHDLSFFTPPNIEGRSEVEAYMKAFRGLASQTPSSPSPIEEPRLAPEDLQVIVDVISGALLAMDDHLRQAASARQRPDSPKPAELSADALDALRMLWNRGALTRSKAISIKKVAPTSMPRRPSRKGMSTYVKAAESGVRQLRIQGLALATQNVGTWLSEAGVATAKRRFGA